MKKLLPPVIALLVGLFLGIGGMVVVMQKGPNQVLATTFLGMTADRAIYGTLLHDKKYAELQTLLEQGLQASLHTIKEMDLNPAHTEPATKFVRGYYDATGRPIPSTTEVMILSVPAGEGTDIRRLSEAASSRPK